MMYQPPFQMTPEIFALCLDISKLLGISVGRHLDRPPVKLRRENSMKTIQASLAIEGNTLSPDQVTALINNKRVVAPSKEIQEVRNAIEVYSTLGTLDPLSSDDILKAHALLMKGLVPSAGKWRSSGVGIFKEDKIAHLPPSAKRVPSLMDDLFGFLKNDADTTWVLKACIFHCELEFIHPFEDGNGRIGRLCQQLILMKEHPIFEYIPVEMLIKRHQDEYFRVLSQCDRQGDTTPFVHFSLRQIFSALEEYIYQTPLPADTVESRLEYAQAHFNREKFSRKDYLSIHDRISTATASRDLKYGIENKLLKKEGDKNQAVYQFVEVIT